MTDTELIEVELADSLRTGIACAKWQRAYGEVHTAMMALMSVVKSLDEIGDDDSKEVADDLSLVRKDIERPLAKITALAMDKSFAYAHYKQTTRVRPGSPPVKGVLRDEYRGLEGDRQRALHGEKPE
jgi:hypothetical protein